MTTRIGRLSPDHVRRRGKLAGGIEISGRTAVLHEETPASSPPRPRPSGRRRRQSGRASAQRQRPLPSLCAAVPIEPAQGRCPSTRSRRLSSTSGRPTTSPPVRHRQSITPSRARASKKSCRRTRHRHGCRDEDVVRRPAEPAFPHRLTVSTRSATSRPSRAARRGDRRRGRRCVTPPGSQRQIKIAVVARRASTARDVAADQPAAVPHQRRRERSCERQLPGDGAVLLARRQTAPWCTRKERPSPATGSERRATRQSRAASRRSGRRRRVAPSIGR